MKHKNIWCIFILCLCTIAVMLFVSSCGDNNNKLQASAKGEDNSMVMEIDGTSVNVLWEDNEAIAELKAQVTKSPITVSASRYGGFEQVGRLGKSYSHSDTHIVTKSGDIMLYNGNQIVVFFGSNEWSYTRLGKIDGISSDDLRTLLDKPNVEIILK